MPEPVGPLGPEQMMWSAPGRSGHRGLNGPTWAQGLGLAQDPLHGAATDLDAGAEHVPRDRTRAEFRAQYKAASAQTPSGLEFRIPAA